MIKTITLISLFFLVGCCGYHGFTKFEARGDHIERNVLGKITVDNGYIGFTRETAISKNAVMCCGEGK